MAATADVVIIGGGIVGASVAYHLTEAGCRNVVIVEREAQPGLGSTSQATGGVHAQFATSVNIQMSLYSIEFLAHLEEATGHSSGYNPCGYLFLATSNEQLATLAANRQRQLSLGVKNVEFLSREEIVAALPELGVDDVVGGNFCQTDGLVDPLSVMNGFMERTLERGVRLWLESDVRTIDLDAKGVVGLRTNKDYISTRAIVNASGAWAAETAKFAGVEVPVEPMRRQLVATMPFAGLPDQKPIVVDLPSGFQFFRDPQAGAPPGVLMEWPDPDETPGFKTGFDPAFVDKVLKHAVHRVPSLAGAFIDHERCRAGLYEMTPDHHAIIGEAPGARGFYLANGFSGHGVMHSPAAGRVVAELVLDNEARTIDIKALRPERFAPGQLLEG